jgi:hypothetical protein
MYILCLVIHLTTNVASVLAFIINKWKIFSRIALKLIELLDFEIKYMYNNNAAFLLYSNPDLSGHDLFCMFGKVYCGGAPTPMIQ